MSGILLKSVDEIIDHETGNWGEGLIQFIFNPVGVDKIMPISLNEHLQEDLWHYI